MPEDFKISFGNRQIVGHVPMSPPKVDGRPKEDATLFERMARGGPLPVKLKKVARETSPPRTTLPAHTTPAASHQVDTRSTTSSASVSSMQTPGRMTTASEGEESAVRAEAIQSSSTVRPDSASQSVPMPGNDGLQAEGIVGPIAQASKRDPSKAKTVRFLDQVPPDREQRGKMVSLDTGESLPAARKPRRRRPAPAGVSEQTVEQMNAAYRTVKTGIAELGDTFGAMAAHATEMSGNTSEIRANTSEILSNTLEIRANTSAILNNTRAMSADVQEMCEASQHRLAMLRNMQEMAEQLVRDKGIALDASKRPDSTG